jgi:hypothetical protein
MNPADTLKGRDRAVELLRQALDTIEALPFTEPAKLDRLEQARNARDAVVLALRALDVPADRSAAQQWLTADQWVQATVEEWHATCGRLADTVEIAVIPAAAGDGGTMTAAGAAGEASTPPAPATPAGVTGIDCIGCGITLAADTLEQLRTLYITHAPQCPHTRSANSGWNAPLAALFNVPGRYTAAATRR